jgi:hypothetical protein
MCGREWLAQYFPSSQRLLLFLSAFMCREMHTYRKWMLASERNILIEFSSVNMTGCETQQRLCQLRRYLDACGGRFGHGLR